MDRLKLLHLTIIGTSVEPATVAFGPGLTLILGPSDTGKSYIAGALDFMLGGAKLKDIREARGYDTVLLGIRLPNDEDVTLVRALQGGNFRLLRGDHRAAPLPADGEALAFKHDARNTANLSRYLLAKIGMDKKKIRKDGAGRTTDFSFRRVVQLAIIGEIPIQAETPPVESGQYKDRTRDISAFRLMLQGDDDSALQPSETRTQRSRSKAAKKEVIDTLLAESRAQIKTEETLAEVVQRTNLLQKTVTESAGNIEEIVTARQQWGRVLAQNERLVAAAHRSLAELDTLQARFGLLYDQYTSDLDRLDAVAETGTLLGYFTPGVCVFCGADPEHQHLNEECDDDTTAFAESVREEQRKTAALREDLLEAIDGLRVERDAKDARLSSYNEQVTNARSRIRRLDEALGPQQLAMDDLLKTSSQLQRDADAIRRVQRLEAMLNEIEIEIETEPLAKPITPTAGLQREAVRELSQMITDRLRAWGYQDADGTSYSFDAQDVVSADQLRSAHGKGVRAILHAAFTISLAQYCFNHNLPHPGFIVLDSPLVVYRPPDSDATVDPGDAVLDRASLAGRFYADVEANFSGQIIILENENPPTPLGADSVNIAFTKNPTQGRYGFFPLAPTSAAALAIDEAVTKKEEI